MRGLLFLPVVLALSAPADAQPLKISFQDGLVSVEATAVPVRTILTEWARLGGTQVVNAEKISGTPLTIQLVNVPESQALEVILRNVAGYMAAPRRVANGPSMYDRILVMPTSTAPAASASAGARGGSNAGTQRNVFQRPEPPDEPTPDETDANVNQPVFSFPQPGQGQGFPQPAQGQNPFQPIGQPTPFGTPIAPGAGQPPVISFTPNGGQSGGVSVNPTPQQTPTLQFPGLPGTNPGGFGVVGSPTPGVVQQPVQPGQPVRPPGGR